VRPRRSGSSGTTPSGTEAGRAAAAAPRAAEPIQPVEAVVPDVIVPVETEAPAETVAEVVDDGTPAPVAEAPAPDQKPEG
ncbi:MAG: hypothetical protein M3P23_10965, partial [Actinomycetota bacterium]|nr:hypothetical protein [Actinomycetota bacterium]